MGDIPTGLISRIATLLVLKALPEEVTLRPYVRNIFRGMIFLVVGSVLLAAVLLGGLYIIYDQLMAQGYDKANVLMVIFGGTLILAAGCFFLADRWLSEKLGERLSQKNIVDQKLHYYKNIVGESINGFVEGLYQGSKSRNSKNDRPKDDSKVVKLKKIS